MRILLVALLAVASWAQRPVFVLSIDGLDARYLNDADQLKLKIPNLRKLVREGSAARGVVGVVPTVTWPSHTTMISGVTPEAHGILGNRRPKDEGGAYYWSAKLLKHPTLLDAMRKAGRTTAAITWPVTVDAPVTYNLPEYFARRRGGAMDLESISSKSAPADLAARISSMFPSFGQEWMDDRTRALAAIYLLKQHKPDLLLMHFVDLDSEAHENGPFTPQANSILEYTDELIGKLLEAMPANYAFVLVSDHGFERIDKDVNLKVLASRQGIEGVNPMGSIVRAESQDAANWLRQQKLFVGREIPKAEIERFSPRLGGSIALFEAAPHVMFADSGSEVESKPQERGEHGHWPSRYRSVYVAWGKGINPEKLPEMQMTEIAGRLASLLGIQFIP